MQLHPRACFCHETAVYVLFNVPLLALCVCVSVLYEIMYEWTRNEASFALQGIIYRMFVGECSCSSMRSSSSKSLSLLQI